jgi:transcriptional regulator MraZ
LFLGKHAGTLDEAGRFSTPSAFKEDLSGGIYITQGFDRNVLVLTTGAFQEIYRSVRSLNVADPLVRLLQRLVLGTAHESGADPNGYITVPGDLKDFADLHEDILLVGQGDYFEIWSPDLWNKQEIQIRDAETNSGRFSTLTIVPG